MRARYAALRPLAERRRERLLHANVGFLVTFAATRAVTHAIKAGLGPFHDVAAKDGRHVHHMTFGILDLLAVGYAWMLGLGTGRGASSVVASRLTSTLYGVGAALTLDEFALWLNLEDDYWTQQGRESIDAVVIFASALGAAALAGPVGRRVVERTVRPTPARPLPGRLGRLIIRSPSRVLALARS